MITDTDKEMAKQFIAGEITPEELASGLGIPPEAIYAAYSEKLAEVRRERDELAEDLKAAQGHITILEGPDPDTQRDIWRELAAEKMERQENTAQGFEGIRPDLYRGDDV